MNIQNKIQTPAEIAWREARSDERWEIYADKVQLFFSQPTCLLPRQIKLVSDAFSSPSPPG